MAKNEIKVDPEDKGLLDYYSVWIDHNGYAICDKMINRKRSRYRLHRLIMNCHEKDKEIDHINRDVLDNRKANLRIVSSGQNSFNRKTLGKYRGGEKLPSGNYSARIGKKPIRIGTFKTAEEAYEAYKKAALDKYGFLPYDIQGVYYRCG